MLHIPANFIFPRKRTIDWFNRGVGVLVLYAYILRGVYKTHAES